MTFPGPILGPCASWCSAAEVAAVCPGASPDDPIVETAAVAATQILWEKSARQFSGVCGPVTVRPQNPDGCNHWGGDFVYGGYTWVWLDSMAGWGWSGENGGPYGCGWLSRVKLNGYPIRDIHEVKIYGAVLPLTYTSGAPTYRLDQWRYLTRMNDPDRPQLVQAWPQCQNLGLDDDQPSTFSITYSYGVEPPSLGILAAEQLACQLSLALSGKPCQLPAGVTRVTKQGVQVDRGVFASWGYDPKKGWTTGLALVDAFLGTYNPSGLRRRPAVIGDGRPFAPQLGEQ